MRSKAARMLRAEGVGTGSGSATVSLDTGSQTASC